MLNIIEPKHHSLYQEKVDSLLGLLKVYQDFSLPLGEPNKAIFIIAEDEMRGIYGGAVLYRQIVKKLPELISKELLHFLPEDEKVWCSCLCFCPDEKEKIAIEDIDLCENFYSELYEVLGELGKKKNTNCLPIALSLKDYHHSLVHGNWSYLEAEPDGSDDVYALLSLPDKRRQSQESRASAQAQNEGKNLKAPLLVPSKSQDYPQHHNQPDRPVQ